MLLSSPIHSRVDGAQVSEPTSAKAAEEMVGDSCRGMARELLAEFCASGWHGGRSRGDGILPAMTAPSTPFLQSTFAGNTLLTWLKRLTCFEKPWQTEAARRTRRSQQAFPPINPICFA